MLARPLLQQIAAGNGAAVDEYANTELPALVQQHAPDQAGAAWLNAVDFLRRIAATRKFAHAIDKLQTRLVVHVICKGKNKADYFDRTTIPTRVETTVENKVRRQSDPGGTVRRKQVSRRDEGFDLNNLAVSTKFFDDQSLERYALNRACVTNRERRITVLLKRGHTYVDIAQRLGVSTATIQHSIGCIRKRAKEWIDQT